MSISSVSAGQPQAVHYGRRPHVARDESQTTQTTDQQTTDQQKAASAYAEAEQSLNLLV